jgi:hypothetical protein
LAGPTGAHHGIVVLLWIWDSPLARGWTASRTQVSCTQASCLKKQASKNQAWMTANLEESKPRVKQELPRGKPRGLIDSHAPHTPPRATGTHRTRRTQRNKTKEHTANIIKQNKTQRNKAGKTNNAHDKTKLSTVRPRRAYRNKAKANQTKRNK